ncbi:hypothetical protein [Streptomyces humidus]
MRRAVSSPSGVQVAWRRCPRRRPPSPTAAGLVLTVLSATGVGPAFKGGGHGDGWLFVAFAGVGVGLALAFSPTLTGALAAVRPEDAADAGGLLATVTRLGQLIGVAVFGTLLFDRLESLGVPGAYTSAEALLTCMFALATTAAIGAVSGLVLRRR